MTTHVPDAADCYSHSSADVYRSARYCRMTGSVGAGPDQMLGVMRIACMSDRMYVTDMLNHRVKVYDLDLNLMFTFGKKGSGDDGFDCPVGVAIGPGDEIFVCDTYNKRIKVYSKEGVFLRIICEEDLLTNNIGRPNDVVISSQGELFVCDKDTYRVHVIRPDGTYLRSIGSKGTGPGQFQDIIFAVAVTQDDRLIVTESSLQSVHVFTTSGEYQGTIPTPVPDILGDVTPTGVAVDTHNNIIMSDWRGGRLVVMDRNGHFLCTIGSKGIEPGQLMRPCGLSLSPEGNIIICDQGKERIQIFHVK